MNCLEAREELEALVRRAVARAARSGRADVPVDEILAAADAYRDAPAVISRVERMHLAGAAGAVTACQYAWREPGRVPVTRNTVVVTCGHCRRSRLFRDLTAGAVRAA